MRTFPLLILIAAVPAAQAMTVDATKARIVGVTAPPGPRGSRPRGHG